MIENGQSSAAGSPLVREPTRHALKHGDYWYNGIIKLGFEAATYRFGWLPERLNPFRPKAVRKAQLALRFQRTPDQEGGTDRMGPLWVEDFWVTAYDGRAEAVLALSFRVAAPSEQAAIRYIEWACSPVPDRIEVTDTEQMCPVSSRMIENRPASSVER